MNRKYLYKNNQNVKQTADIGQIVPVFWRTYYPGETLKELSFKNITRMITPLFPTLDNPNIKLFTFKVPYRVINNYGLIKEDESYLEIGESWKIHKEDDELKNALKDWTKLKEKYPTIKNTHEPGLLKKFGLNNFFFDEKTPEDIEIDIQPILAYHVIYNSFFRNKQIENNLLSSILPNIRNNENDKHNIIYMESYQNSEIGYLDAIGKVNQENNFLYNLNFTSQKDSNFNSFLDLLYKHGQNITDNKIIANQINNGTNKDILLKVWNANNKDKTEPELLGYYKWEQAIQQITNQSQDGLGDVGGQSVRYNEGLLCKDVNINEHCIIMTVAVANYPLTILNYYDPFEYFDTQYEPGKEEEIQRQINTDNIGIQLDRGAKPIGFIKPWDILRNPHNRVLGEFRDSLKQWAYSIKITENINTNYIKIIKKPFKDTLTTNEDSFLMEYNFYTEELRHIKPYSEIIEQDTEII